MDGIIPKLRWVYKERLVEQARRCRDARLKTHYLVIVNLLEGRSPTETAKALGMGKTTVYRVAQRFREQGELGLLDHREDNGERKLDERYLAELHEVVRRNPQEVGGRRPTGARERVVRTVGGGEGGGRPQPPRVWGAASDVDAGDAGPHDGGVYGGACTRHDPESGTEDDPGASWASASDRGLPLVETQEKPADSLHPGVARVPAEGSRSGLRGRSGYSPESQDRSGLDGARTAEGGPDAGTERQTLPGRSHERGDGETGRGGGDAQMQ